MDWHNEWIKTQRDLSAASKADHYWRTMPREMRARMSATEYRQKSAAALKRLRQADDVCRSMIRARRSQVGKAQASMAPVAGPVGYDHSLPTMSA